MKNFNELNYLVFRSVMGVNMVIHGGSRLFGDYIGFIDKMQAMFKGSIVPEVLTTVVAQCISPVELIFGVLLLIGFKTRISILALMLNMMVLVSGVCLLQKWELAGLQMTYVLYLFVLGCFYKFNAYSIDEGFRLRQPNV